MSYTCNTHVASTIAVTDTLLDLASWGIAHGTICPQKRQKYNVSMTIKTENFYHKNNDSQSWVTSIKIFIYGFEQVRARASTFPKRLCCIKRLKITRVKHVKISLNEKEQKHVVWPVPICLQDRPFWMFTGRVNSTLPNMIFQLTNTYQHPFSFFLFSDCDLLLRRHSYKIF